jgi:hypothetical protein
VSFEVASRDLNFRSVDGDRAVVGVVRSYRRAIREFAAMGDLDVWVRAT